MRDPYLYDDVNVLVNLANIKDSELLRKAEADITSISMVGIYNIRYSKFDAETLQDIHRKIFGQIYPWAGEFRTIQMTKPEEVLGGDTVRYSYPKDIKKELNSIMKEIDKLKRNGKNDNDIVFKLVRITSKIWQIHPFREGNTRSVMAFSVLLANSLGYDVNHELFKTNSNYVRNALVWCSQGIYSKYEYLERIFFDAILHKNIDERNIANEPTKENKYDTIGSYQVKDYKERPHEYADDLEEGELDDYYKTIELTNNMMNCKTFAEEINENLNRLKNESQKHNKSQNKDIDISNISFDEDDKCDEPT